MAKRNNIVAFQKGLLDVGTMEITEKEKEEEFVYDLLAELRRFDGKYITLTIKEDLPVQPKR